jgi:hypothetical protein
MPTCKADAVDDIKPLTHDSVNNVLVWLANTPLLQAPRIAFRFTITALIIGVIACIACTPFLGDAYMKECCFKISPTEKRRDYTANNNDISFLPRYIVRSVSQGADGAFTFLRKMLFVFFCGGLGMIQVATGYVAGDPLRFCCQAAVTMLVSLSIAQYTTKTIWHYCVVGIDALASTMQVIILGPFSIA